MTAQLKWIVAVAALLAANVVAMIVLAVVANNGTNQVIPDYYAKATNYDAEMARSAASQALGWRAELAVTGGALEATITDAAGAPLDGARVRITGYHRAHADQALDLALAAAGPGRYRGALEGRRGRHDLVVTVDARGAQYVRHVVVEVP